MLVSQDIVRRNILGVKDTPGNLSIDLMMEIVKFGIHNYEIIIIEGILNKDRYEALLTSLQTLGCKVQFYYLDIPIETPFKRHNSKRDVTFDHDDLKKWWVDKDVLESGLEHIINEERFALDTALDIIGRLKD